MKTISQGFSALLPLLLAVAVCGCFRQDVETMEVRIPQMGTPTCASAIIDRLTPVEGIKTARPDLQNQTLTVTYNSTLLARKNIIYMITDMGFTANGNEPRPGRGDQLPEPCR